jgi:hypothetical protein
VRSSSFDISYHIVDILKSLKDDACLTNKRIMVTAPTAKKPNDGEYHPNKIKQKRCKSYDHADPIAILMNIVSSSKG